MTRPRSADGYSVPVQADAPWPTFRRDPHNSGLSPTAARYHGDQPWSFQTGKGIFSTPVIDGQGTVYIGSADHIFYAIRPDGTEKWRCQTGEVIDSAGALLAAGLSARPATVVFPSGDGLLRCVECDGGAPVWVFDAQVSPRASYNNWFEGNVAVGRDGTLYAGNTNFNYYAIHPDGTLKWTYPAGSNAWSLAALADDGTIFWGSNDGRMRAVRADGTEKWCRRTWGIIAASAALGSDGTVYIGSFDSTLYALDPRTGRTRWKFRTGDHLYGSAALGADDHGTTTAIFIGSTDGCVYALNPDGSLAWKYDAGAPIRSSPVLGGAPEAEGEGEILYFGCGNGRLYALDAARGTRRWSFDTTPGDPELRDRNDLNGSPALGQTGIYIGGEHGQLWYVPYDYPLHAADGRGCTDPGDDLPANAARLYYVSAGGNVQWNGPPEPATATAITLKLVVRRDGETLGARLLARGLHVQADPPFPFHARRSADGRYLHVLPDGFLEPGTRYSLRVSGGYGIGGLYLGNLVVGGWRAGHFEDEIAFRTTAPVADRLPLSVGDSRTAALEWTRLAVPIPSMMPSLNQIGFDSMDWIVGTVAVTPIDERRGRVILWAIGGRRDEQGRLVADPASDFTLPLAGRYQDDTFIVANEHFAMAITGIPIPFNHLELRGRMGPDLRALPGATVLAETRVLSIPTFGLALVLAGLASDGWRTLRTVGTFITRPYDEAGGANRRPAGVSIGPVTCDPPSRRRAGRVEAAVRLEPGAAYPVSAHRPGILLVDAAGREVLSLDYHRQLATTADADGNLSAVSLVIPAGTRLPAGTRAVVLLDVFPMHECVLHRT